MSKVKVTIGYSNYVMNEDAAIAMFKMLNGKDIEKLEQRYDSESKVTTHFVKPLERGLVTLESIAASDYAIWRLADASLKEGN